MKSKIELDYLTIEPKNGKRTRITEALLPELDDEEVNLVSGINSEFSFLIVEDDVYTEDDEISEDELENYYYDPVCDCYYKIVTTYYTGDTYRLLVIDNEKEGLVPNTFFNSDNTSVAIIYENKFIKFVGDGTVTISVAADLTNTGDFIVMDDLTRKIKIHGGESISGPENNEIWYTSSDGNIVEPSNISFGDDVNLLSNEYIDGKGIITFDNDVIKIGGYAFYGCNSLTSITIPNSVTFIDESAFNSCTDLTSINIPNSVTYIEGNAFNSCTSLTSIDIPNSVTYIGYGAFDNCTSLTSINIPNSVTEIDGYSFYNCTSLTSIDIPNSVTSIGERAFYGCSSLTSITVGSENTVYDSRDNCNAIINTTKNQLMYGCKNTTIPNSITSINNYAFYGCTGLTSITIPNSVTSIGEYAFSECYFTSSNFINNSSCTSRNNWGATIVDSEVSGMCIKDNTIIYVRKTATGSLVIPSNVTSINSVAFQNCKYITSVSIPANTENLYYPYFSGCTSLETITVDSGNTVYDSRNNCNAIINTTNNQLMCGCKNTIIPDTVTDIYYEAFMNTGLTYISIPISVTTIGLGVFDYCPDIDIEYQGTIEQWDDNVDFSTLSQHYSYTLTIHCTDGDLQYNISYQPPA